MYAPQQMVEHRCLTPGSIKQQLLPPSLTAILLPKIMMLGRWSPFLLGPGIFICIYIYISITFQGPSLEKNFRECLPSTFSMAKVLPSLPWWLPLLCLFVPAVCCTSAHYSFVGGQGVGFWKKKPDGKNPIGRFGIWQKVQGLLNLNLSLCWYTV